MKERQRKARRQRAAQGTAALDQFKGRTAEKQLGKTRTDYTPQPAPIIHPPKIKKEKPAKHKPGQIGPKEGFLKIN
jgi:hypothetical protein